MSTPKYGQTSYTFQAINAQGGGKDENFSLTNFSADDFVSMAFKAVDDYYVVGLMAYVSDSNVVNAYDGWGLFKHEQSAWPNHLAVMMGLLGLAIADYPELPSFEAKYFRIYADQDCWIRFGGPDRVQHFIPATTWVEFRRRANMIWIQRDSADGTAYVSMYG